tara:strand:+ start:3980 stop:4237 length:258 start_codon:yes stop_codon:yes gene_type:complete
MSNYPPGMDWAAFDDYYDPPLTCGHRVSDCCDCWCDGGEGSPHYVDECDGSNCSHFRCDMCDAPSEEEIEICIECKKEMEEDENE